jgi:hypothetical protein
MNQGRLLTPYLALVLMWERSAPGVTLRGERAVDR